MDLDLGLLARRLSEDNLSSKTVLEVCLRRIERVDPSIRAFRSLDAEGARRQSVTSDRRDHRIGPLDGVPIAVKDNIDIAGLVTRSGLGPRAEQPAAKDAEIVTKLREAGAVILGHLNMHEGALGATTDNPHYGKSHNPRRLGHTPGGSSGGSAAAVAARLCPLALGTDTLGSVRLPAAYCGIVGFKPSLGLLDNRGIEPLCRRLDQVGPMARSVSDLCLFFEALGGLPKARIVRDMSLLRFGRLAELDDIALSDDVRRAFENACHRIKQTGAEIVEVSMPSYSPSSARRAGLLLAEAEAASTFAADMDAYPNAFSESFAALLDFGAQATVDKLGEAEQRVEEAALEFGHLFEAVDLLIAPTAAQTAFPFSEVAPPDQADLTALANLSGAPAISLPIPSADLPVGLQVMGRSGDDTLILTVAELMEQDLWFKGEDLSLEDLL